MDGGRNTDFVQVMKEDSKEIISFLKNYDAEIFTREIIFTKADMRALGFDRLG